MAKKYQLESYLNDLYTTFPEAKPQPVIGLVADYAEGDALLRSVYYKQVVASGATPLIIPPVADANIIINSLEKIDGLILTGGADINPLWANQEPEAQLGHINRERDLPELLTIRLAYNRQIPMLGICRGMQAMAIALGGKVKQHLVSTIKHNQEADKNEATHSIQTTEGTTIAQLYGEQAYVNSFHHQVVIDAGEHFVATAHAADGVIETIESNEYKPYLGVQWHPEWMEEEGQKLFQWLTDQAAIYQRAKHFHQHHLTLDSHCDTPMFFPQGIRFDHRDPKILYDLHKMTDSYQDAVTMVAYLPQHPKPGEIPEGMSPRQYADSIFDKIDTIIADKSQYLSLAKTPDDLYRNKALGKKSIMIGIENGLAIEDDIHNVEHFAKRGIVYITLCHNGDNAICDSARGEHTHGGVSQFGEQVIQEMNRLGVMVDLSHGGEKSFYDALEISKSPIVCSHSNSKVLCDVPRNLTDDQMRALANRGGVAQVTLYHGFLRKEGEASVRDAIDHLNHAVKVMGIDHVGIGTDFDGDGGVKGAADASELINFTMHILRERYTEEDLQKIWGENWLRVMREAQSLH